MSPDILGKTLIGIGIVLLIFGGITLLASQAKIPFLGKLPGDFYMERGNFVFYFPLTTTILISIVISIIFNFFSKK